MTQQRDNGRDLWGTLRKELTMRDSISAVLRQRGSATINEVAEALDEQPYEVTHWMMTMRRYGRITEVGEVDDDGYFQYAVATRDSETEAQSEEA